MEALILFSLIIIVLCLVLPFVAMAKASRAQRAIEALTARIARLEKGAPQPVSSPVGESVAFPGKLTASPTEKGKETPPPPVSAPSAVRPASVPPPLPPDLIAASAVTPAAPKKTAPPVPARTKSPINWEQFMGAKLFAWIGGFALFLGVAFFIKYSFEHNLIPPEARVAIGFAVGLALLVGGVALEAQRKCGHGADALRDRDIDSLRRHLCLPILLSFFLLRIDSDFSAHDADHCDRVSRRGAARCHAGGGARHRGRIPYSDFVVERTGQSVRPLWLHRTA